MSSDQRIMKLSTYNDIIAESQRWKPRPLSKLQIFFPNIHIETLKSIIAQNYQRKMKKSFHRCCSPKLTALYYKQFLKAVSNNEEPGIVMRLADQVEVSPALMARSILEHHYSTLSDEGKAPTKKMISKLMRDTSLIEHKDLAVEVFMCIQNDENYGPTADVIHYSVGLEHEMMLKKELKALGIAFVDETVLRERGYDKTPDVKLEIPVAFDGHVVNWIESKALFGDIESHNSYLKDQYWSYWNRFGPGMVIYWFGFIEELDKDQGILLKTSVPKNPTYMDPTSQL